MKKISILLFILLILTILYAATEDFSTYTEVDPYTAITVSADSIHCTAIQTRGNDSYVYRDFGENHFSGNFEIQFTVYSAEHNTDDAPFFWMLSNNIDDVQSHVSNAWNFLNFYLAGTNELKVWEKYDGDDYLDQYTLASPFKVYVTVERDTSVGDNGIFNAYIYSDAGRTSRLDSIGVSLHGHVSYQYMYGFNNINTGSPGYVWTGGISDMEIVTEESQATKRNVIVIF